MRYFIDGVLFSPDDNMIAMILAHAVSLWDANNYALVRTLAPTRHLPHIFGSDVFDRPAARFRRAD